MAVIRHALFLPNTPAVLSLCEHHNTTVVSFPFFQFDPYNAHRVLYLESELLRCLCLKNPCYTSRRGIGQVGSDSVIMYALHRAVNEAEFAEWLNNLESALQTDNRGSDFVSAIRQFYILCMVTKYDRT